MTVVLDVGLTVASPSTEAIQQWLSGMGMGTGTRWRMELTTAKGEGVTVVSIARELPHHIA